MTMPAPNQLTSAELAATKAALATQQAAELAAITESETALHKLADMFHNEAFANDAQTPKPSFADSLRAAATALIAQAAKQPNFPAAALANLQRYAAGASAASATPGADPIAAAETAAATLTPVR
jgi:hypothetical protein